MPDFIKAIGAARFGVMAGVAAALTAFFLYVAGVISEPPKTILFSGLESRDAAAVTAKLDAMNVPYEAKGDGATILVPADQVTKLRMQLAQENLPAAGVGYEIFDKSDAFGTTAFVQNINRLRALEGELARSIQTIDGIESVRVHLVIPERQIFSRDSQSPSASVVVKTRAMLAHGQVQAIQHLVAAAVASLSPDRVAIVDDRGNLLAGGQEKAGDDAAAGNGEQDTTDFEDRMRRRVESMVASIVGQGHVRAEVTAEMNYTHTTSTSEDYNPDSKVVRSTQTVEQNSNDSNGAGAGAVSVGNALPGQQNAAAADNTKSTSGRTEETTNYEISKTVTTSATEGKDGNTLKRLSIAVAVDGTATDGGGYKPRSAQELKQIDTLVRSAIGYDAARGDQVQVVNMPFARVDTIGGTPAPSPFLGLDGPDWFKIIEAAILSVTALLIGLFVMRPLIARMFSPISFTTAPAQIASGTPAAGQLAAPSAQNGEAHASQGHAPAQISAPRRESMIDISQIEGQVRESSVKKVGEVVQAHPEEALAILRTWLHQPV